MQQVRLWQVTPDQGLSEIPARPAGLEQRLESWLADDISVLDDDLIVIGKQVHTNYGGIIDLLCLDVPIVYYAVDIWQGGLHPDRGTKWNLATPMQWTWMVSLAAFILLFVLLMVLRYQQKKTEQDFRDLRDFQDYNPQV